MKRLVRLLAFVSAIALSSTQAADLKENWNKHCAKCHGADGKGDTKMGKKIGVKDYTDAKVQAEMKDDKALKSLLEGMKEGETTKMKPFGKTLSEEELKALIQHMRTFKR